MATKRFCDICDRPLKPEDDKPFIRELEYLPPGLDYPPDQLKDKIQAHVMVMNEHAHVIADVCLACKLKVVNEGKPVATLQAPPTPTFPIVQAPIKPFEPSLKPELPKSPAVVFEETRLPGDRPKPRIG